MQQCLELPLVSVLRDHSRDHVGYQESNPGLLHAAHEPSLLNYCSSPSKLDFCQCCLFCVDKGAERREILGTALDGAQVTRRCQDQIEASLMQRVHSAL